MRNEGAHRLYYVACYQDGKCVKTYPMVADRELARKQAERLRKDRSKSGAVYVVVDLTESLKYSTLTSVIPENGCNENKWAV